MRLTYNILWIENEQDWLDPSLEFAREIVEENGFELNHVVKSSEKEIEDMLSDVEPFKNFDLILVDFQLDRGDRGNKIIANIRDHKIFTEVIFYSQDTEGVRQAIKDHWLDGIYCASRDRNDFEYKFEKVFLTTIKKIQHISSMRGLVLSETSQLDNIVEEILHAFLEKRKDEDKKALKKYIISDLIKDSAKSNLKKAEKLEDAIENSDLINHKLFDAYKKMRSTAKIIEILNNEAIINKDTFLKEYNDEVIEIRNDLAHANEVEDAGKKLLKCIKGPREFDEKECISIRNNLKKHFKYLEAIKASI